MSDPLLQDRVGRQADGVADVLGLEQLVQLGLGEGRVAAEIENKPSAAVAGDHRLEHHAPAFNGMDGPRLRHHRAKRVGHDTRRPSVAEIATVGLDLAKNWFQVHGADARGRPVLRKKLARSKVLEFFANLPPCLVGMEACGSAHHWARELIKLGHEVRLMPPQYVKPYVKTNKHDAADAEAICEAVTRPSMRFVPVKSIEQQTLAQLHRIRQLLVKQKIMHVNALRGHLAELGIVRGQGQGKVGELVRLIEAASDDGIPAKMRQQLRHLVELLRDLRQRLAELDRELGELARANPAARRLATIPGVGPVTATALVVVIGDIGRFRSGRHLAAYLGLVPEQHASGGKQRLGTISKRGDTYLRTLLAHGARARGAGHAHPAGAAPGLDRSAAAAPAGQRGGDGAGQPDGADRLGAC